MQFSGLEMAIAVAAVRTTGKIANNGDPIGRQFSIDEMPDAVSVIKKIKEHVIDDKINDGEVEFSTSEKALLLKLLKEREWAEIDGEFVLTLIEKIK